MRIYFILLFSLLLIACKREQNEAPKFSYLTQVEALRQDSILNKCNCKLEFEFTKLFLYYLTYERPCIKSHYYNTNIFELISGRKSEIVLSPWAKYYDSMDEYSDTINFHMSTLVAKGCYCSELKDPYNYEIGPATHIKFIRSKKKIIFVAELNPSQNSMYEAFIKMKSDTIMQSYVINNKKLYDDWFVQKIIELNSYRKISQMDNLRKIKNKKSIEKK